MGLPRRTLLLGLGGCNGHCNLSLTRLGVSAAVDFPLEIRSCSRQRSFPAHWFTMFLWKQIRDAVAQSVMTPVGATYE